MRPQNIQVLFRVAQWTMENKRKTVKIIRELSETEENYLIIIREIDRVNTHLEKSKAINAEATLTLIDWLTTLEYFQWQCAYCASKPFQVMSHFIPLPRGGTTPDNCVPSCYSCKTYGKTENMRLQAYLVSRKHRTEATEKEGGRYHQCSPHYKYNEAITRLNVRAREFLLRVFGEAKKSQARRGRETKWCLVASI